MGRKETAMAKVYKQVLGLIGILGAIAIPLGLVLWVWFSWGWKLAIIGLIINTAFAWLYNNY
jgi:hypothetical protein